MSRSRVLTTPSHHHQLRLCLRSNMSRLELLLLLLSVVLLGSNDVQGQPRSVQRFEREPEDQTAVVGETVILGCRVLNKAGVLQWTKDDFGLGSDRNLTGFERYSMIGSDEEGTYSLQIKPVTLDDDGVFQCQVSPGTGSPAIRSRYATLAVHIPPEPPQIVQGAHLMTTEDREVELECLSNGGKPPAEINWLDGDANLITDGVEIFKEVLADGKRTNVKSVLKLSPTKAFHDKNITCQAQNAAERSPRTAVLHMEVKYAPKVSIQIEQDQINEFDSVRLTCQADANPADVVYKWYINDDIAYGDYSTQLVIASANRKLNQAIVKCEVTNAVGRSEDTQTLNIHYGPVIRNRPANTEADVGSSVTLRCDFDANPEPEITWSYESSRRVLSTGPAYTFWMASDMAGKYTCTARVPGFADVTAESHVLLKGPPTVTSKRIQFGLEGDTTRIECVAFAVPRPEKVVWTHLGYEVDSGDHRISILEDILPDGVRSTLVVRDAQDHDFGSYNCSVANAYGSDAVEIVLKKQKSLPLLIILAGVIGGLVIIIACIMVLILCNKRSKKVEEVEKADKTSKQSDQTSNNDSDLKVDIRTASSLSNPPESDQWDDSSERITPRTVLPINNGDSLYHYGAGLGVGGVGVSGVGSGVGGLGLGGVTGVGLSAGGSDYPDGGYAPKVHTEGHNNNGYVPYVDYGRDYNPSLIGLANSRSSLYTTNPHTAIPMSAIDPRFSAAYGNPYLRSSTTSLPPPHLSNGVGAAAATAYGSIRNGAAPQVGPGARTPPPGAPASVSSSAASQYIVSNKAQLKPGTLATHV